MVKRATSLFNLFFSNIARHLARFLLHAFCCPFFHTLTIACTLYKLHSTCAKYWSLYMFNIKFSKCGTVSQLQVPVLMPNVSSEFVVGSHLCLERFSFSTLIFPFSQRPTITNTNSILECTNTFK